ncbi:MAG TPA: hypothetical protein VG319_04550, partial [Polyangia bacterium]|nr:hypothetical protein [Polyangia bacterium]
MSQSAVAPVHAVAFVAEHAPQAPLGWHAPLAPGQSPSPTQPRQTWVVSSHTGDVAVPHWALARHATHTPAWVSQSGVAAMHAVAFEAEHAPQAPLGSHAGVVPPQSVSAAQARHLFVPVSQTGFVPPHCASVVHDRHVPVAASQPGVGPVHFELFVAEHTPHAPLGSHAGVAPAHSLSAAQARHTCAVTSHVGVAPPHCALVRHPTQLPTGTSQTEVAPTQR